jgi:hypothetical protein
MRHVVALTTPLTVAAGPFGMSKPAAATLLIPPAGFP